MPHKVTQGWRYETQVAHITLVHPNTVYVSSGGGGSNRDTVADHRK